MPERIKTFHCEQRTKCSDIGWRCANRFSALSCWSSLFRHFTRWGASYGSAWRASSKLPQAKSAFTLKRFPYPKSCRRCSNFGLRFSATSIWGEYFSSPTRMRFHFPITASEYFTFVSFIYRRRCHRICVVMFNTDALFVNLYAAMQRSNARLVI